MINIEDVDLIISTQDVALVYMVCLMSQELHHLDAAHAGHLVLEDAAMELEEHSFLEAVIELYQNQPSQLLVEVEGFGGDSTIFSI